MKIVGFMLVAGLAVLSACGDDNGNKTADASTIDSAIDGTPQANNFTTFVIGIVTSTTEGSTVAVPTTSPHPFSDFSEATLMDTDQNNQAAYASLFM